MKKTLFLFFIVNILACDLPLLQERKSDTELHRPPKEWLVCSDLSAYVLVPNLYCPTGCSYVRSYYNGTEWVSGGIKFRDSASPVCPPKEIDWCSSVNIEEKIAHLVHSADTFYCLIPPPYTIKY